MPRRIRKKRSVLAPIADSFINKLSSTNTRTRKRVLRIGGWIIGLLFLYSLMSGNYGIPRIVRLELEHSRLMQANQRLAAELVDNERIRRKLKSDPAYIEYIARSQYFMVRPDETVYRTFRQ